jgi:Mg/Co/Ni transporter MgtE
VIAHCRYRISAATVIAAALFLLGEATYDEAVSMIERLMGLENSAEQRGPP